MIRRWLSLAATMVLGATPAAWADGPQDNVPASVRRIPKLGIDVPAEIRAELERGLADLRSSIEGLGRKRDARTMELLPDVEVFAKAAHDALAYQEFFAPQEFTKARGLLKEGQDRAKG